MMYSKVRLFFVLLAVMAISCQSSKQEKYLLRLTPPPDFSEELEMAILLNAKLFLMSFDTDMKWFFRMQVDDTEGEDILFTTTFDRTTIKGSLPGDIEIYLDSDQWSQPQDTSEDASNGNGAANGPAGVFGSGSELFKGLIDEPLQIRINRRGQFVEYGELKEALSQEMLEELGAQQGLAEYFTYFLPTYPEDSVSVGDSWESYFDFENSANRMHYTYTLEDVRSDEFVVEMTGRVEPNPDAEEEQAYELDSQVKGTFTIDRATGFPKTAIISQYLDAVGTKAGQQVQNSITADISFQVK